MTTTDKTVEKKKTRAVKVKVASVQQEVMVGGLDDAGVVKTYILDTNVLLSDGNVLSAFDEHNIVIPYIVLEEMDRHKDRSDEVGRNAREFVRKLKAISTDVTDMRHWFSRGPKLGQMKIISIGDITGWDINKRSLPIELQSHQTGDNTILEFCMAYSANEPCILVSRDTVLRIKCKTVGIPCEDYRKLNVVASASSLFSGITETDVLDVGDLYSASGLNASDVLPPDLLAVLHPNEFIAAKTGQSSYMARFIAPNKPLRQVSGDIASSSKIRPKNREQRFSFDLLYDEAIKLVTLSGRAGVGKAQPLDAKILTPTGWTTMGQLNVGDFVMAKNGSPTKVTGIFPQGTKKIYKITFSDGTSTRCCDDHLWLTQSKNDRRKKMPGTVKTLAEVRRELRNCRGQNNQFIPMVDTIAFQPTPVPLDPYLLGLLIGDGGFANGSVRLTTADPELVNETQARLPKNCAIIKCGRSKIDYSITDSRSKLAKHEDNIRAILLSPTGEEQTIGSTSIFAAKNNVSPSGIALLLKGKIKQLKGWVVREKAGSKPELRNDVVIALGELGLLGHKSETKFVPSAYKYNSAHIRLAILQGLLDTDGTVSKNGYNVSFSSTSKQLALDVQELVWSFGGKAVISNRQTYYTYKGFKKAGMPSFVVRISLPAHISPFRLGRKANLYIPRTKYAPLRSVAKIEFVGMQPAQCIAVDDSDHLYVTDDYIVTHNTIVALEAGLEQVLNKRRYASLVICRPVMPLGKDIGFLPGSMAEKMEPWMAPIKDNLRYILNTNAGGLDEKSGGSKKTKRGAGGGAASSYDEMRGGSDKGHLENTLQSFFDEGIIEIQPLTYIRGRSIPNAFIIVDEAQNTSLHEIKTILTRAGDGTKIVLLGDIEQIDRNDVDSVSNGLTTVVEKFKDSPIAGHVSLTKGERSPLATIASEILG